MTDPAFSEANPGGKSGSGVGASPSDSAQGPLNICLLGGSLSTGNLGVSALGLASIKGILGVFPAARILLQDWGDQSHIVAQLGNRNVTVEVTDFHFAERLRARAGTRHLRLLANVHRRLPLALRRWLCAANSTFDQLLGVDSALALCGGDSFSDLYGQSGLWAQASMLLLMSELGKPLILMPQTLGPFASVNARHLARQVFERCQLVATRDLDGVDNLRRTFGGWLPSNTAICPDVGFTLDPLAVAREREPFVLGSADDRPLIGLNVSGLLYLSSQRFGLKDSYSHLIDAIIEWACSRADRRLLLVPHVISPTPPEQDPTLLDRTYDVSDTAACRLVLSRYGKRYGDRIGCLGWPYTAGETKFLISHCDFMIGARMHACIGGTSQGVPTVTLAYSKKAQSVMGQLDGWAPVIDLRQASTDECLREIESCYLRRMDLRAGLMEMVPSICRKVETFFAQQLGEVILRRSRAGIIHSR